MLWWIPQMSGAYKDEQAAEERARERERQNMENAAMMHTAELSAAESVDDTTYELGHHNQNPVLSRMECADAENQQMRKHIKAITELLNSQDEQENPVQFAGRPHSLDEPAENTQDRVTDQGMSQK